MMKSFSGLWFLFFLMCFGFSVIEAAQVPVGQDVGATVQMEKTEKEQRAMIKKLSQKKKLAGIEEKEILQTKK